MYLKDNFYQKLDELLPFEFQSINSINELTECFQNGISAVKNLNKKFK